MEGQDLKHIVRVQILSLKGFEELGKAINIITTDSKAYLELKNNLGSEFNLENSNEDIHSSKYKEKGYKITFSNGKTAQENMTFEIEILSLRLEEKMN